MQGLQALAEAADHRGQHQEHLHIHQFQDANKVQADEVIFMAYIKKKFEKNIWCCINEECSQYMVGKWIEI